MNILIDVNLHNKLLQGWYFKLPMGSQLYNTTTRSSDSDWLVLYYPEQNQLTTCWSNHHQMLWKNTDPLEDWVWCSFQQFFQNLISGDSPLNAEVLFSKDFSKVLEIDHLKPDLITYDLLKGYLGMAKRDLNQWEQNPLKKSFHAWKSCHFVKELLNKNLNPHSELLKETWNSFSNLDKTGLFDIKQELFKEVNELRLLITRSLELGNLSRYPSIETQKEIDKLLYSFQDFPLDKLYYTNSKGLDY